MVIHVSHILIIRVTLCVRDYIWGASKKSQYDSMKALEAMVPPPLNSCKDEIPACHFSPTSLFGKAVQY